MIGGILIVDDDAIARRLAQEILSPLGLPLRFAVDGVSAMTEMEASLPEAVLLDLGLPDTTGRELMARMLAMEPELPVVVSSIASDVDEAVRMLRSGAFDYLVKPVHDEELIVSMRRALERKRLLGEVIGLRDEMNVAMLENRMGPSALVQQLASRVATVARSSMSVLILGETGSGKEVVARAIHAGSARRNKPFVAVDCGAIPETLFESTLFGHEDGAFTGARGKRRGLALEANGGTLFLDEIGNLGLASQAKLLRALDERIVRPLGGMPVPIDIRLVAATNEQLDAQIEHQKFREDLYYRIAEFALAIPPLRERLGDIAHLARRFREDAAAELERPVTAFSGEALALLRSHDWPGNVRELRNVVRRLVLACDGLTVQAHHVEQVLAAKRRGSTGHTPPPEARKSRTRGRSLKEIGDEAAGIAERAAILEVLEELEWNQTACARALQIDAKTLYRKMRQYGISRPVARAPVPDSGEIARAHEGRVRISG